MSVYNACMHNCPTHPQVERDGRGTNALSCSTRFGLCDNLEGAVATVTTVILSKNVVAASVEEEFLLIKGDVIPFSIQSAGAPTVFLGAFPFTVSAGAAV